jgi:hypothetical protein
MNGHGLLWPYCKKDEGKGENDSIYKYLADTGFEPDEVKNWGRIGSLMEALSQDDSQPCNSCLLDESFVDFVAKLPPGNTPRPSIRNQLQRPPVV